MVFGGAGGLYVSDLEHLSQKVPAALMTCFTARCREAMAAAGVLHCVAVCCNVLQCVARSRKGVAVCCSVLQCMFLRLCLCLRLCLRQHLCLSSSASVCLLVTLWGGFGL